MAFSAKIYGKFAVEYAAKIKTSQHLAKLQARKLIVSRILCAWALSCWKMKKSPDILSTGMAVDDCFYIDFNLA